MAPDSGDAALETIVDDSDDLGAIAATDGRVPGRRGSGHPHPPARVHRRAPRLHPVALDQGHRHRPAGRHLSGHLLPVLRERRAGHPGHGRGAHAGSGHAGRAGRRRLVRRGQLGHGPTRGRGLHGLLGRQPGRLPCGRAGHRGGGPALPGPAGAGPQRRHRHLGPRHRVGRAQPQPGRHRRHGRGGHPHLDAGPRRRPPLRVRVLGHPHHRHGRHPGARAALGRHGGRPRRAERRDRRRAPRTGPVVGGGAAQTRVGQARRRPGPEVPPRRAT